LDIIKAARSGRGLEAFNGKAHMGASRIDGITGGMAAMCSAYY